eukprot:624136-Prymnesium_polylepis.1
MERAGGESGWRERVERAGGESGWRERVERAEAYGGGLERTGPRKGCQALRETGGRDGRSRERRSQGERAKDMRGGLRAEGDDV